MRSAFSMLIVLVMAAAASAAQTSHVIFKPFTEADSSQQADWISRALNQSVLDELASMQDISVTTPQGSNLQPAAAQSTNPSTQPAGAADFIVSGTIQRINQQLRVTGAVTNAQGKTVGGFKATGSEQDLFAIEDSIAEQLRGTLGISEQPPAMPMSAATQGQQPTSSGSYEGSDLQRSVQDPTFTRRLSDRSYYNTEVATPPGTIVPGYTSGYGYGYGTGYYPPYYGGGWGWGWGPSVVIINPDRDRDHHHGNRPTPRPNPNNGQAIRREAVGAGGNISSSPQLVPSGGPQLVPSGGPQLVPGNPVPRGMGGGGSAPGAGNPMPAHAPGAGYNANSSPAPGAGHH